MFGYKEYFNSHKLLPFPRVSLEWFISPGLLFSAFCIPSLMSTMYEREGEREIQLYKTLYITLFITVQNDNICIQYKTTWQHTRLPWIKDIMLQY